MIVTEEEFERELERARLESAGAAEGLYGPSSMAWHVGRESIVFLGAGRAALLQLAHPYVAHAIEQHSETRTDPLGRFNRTFVAVYGMIFGELEAALGAARRVRSVHDRIHGPIEEDVARFTRGHRYRAHDGPALLWVWATLVETSILAFEIGVRSLTAAEKDGYYRDLTRFARLFGIGDALLPPDWPAFQRYCRAMWASDELGVGKPAREIGRFLLAGPGGLTRPLMRWYTTITAGLLPPRIRDAYGLSFGRVERRVYDASLRALRASYARLPERLRHVPDYVEAMRRIDGKPRRDRVGRAVEQLLLRGVRPS